MCFWDNIKMNLK